MDLWSYIADISLILLFVLNFIYYGIAGGGKGDVFGFLFVCCLVWSAFGLVAVSLWFWLWR